MNRTKLEKWLEYEARRYDQLYHQVNRAQSAVSSSFQPANHPQYTDIAHDQFRLVRIAPGFAEDLLVLSIEVHSLRRSPRYFAISYTWGETPGGQFVLVDGQSIEVQANCWHALWQARLNGCLLCWVDSLCINQIDQDEKAIQVNMMSSIYSEAEEVLICLGKHSDDSQYAFDRLHQLTADEMWPHHDKVKYDGLIDDIRRDERLKDATSLLRGRMLGMPDLLRFAKALSRLGERRYWHRTWVIQEIECARKATVLVDTDDLSLVLLRAAVAVLVDGSDRRHPAARFSQIMLRDERSRDENTRRTLLGLVNRHLTSHCSMMLDHIFALASIARDPVKANYKASPADMVFEVVPAYLVADKFPFGPLTLIENLLRVLNIDATYQLPSSTIPMGVLLETYCYAVPIVMDACQRFSISSSAHKRVKSKAGGTGTPIFAGDCLVATACSLQPGDLLLVEYHHRRGFEALFERYPDVAFVIRPFDERFEIIGQAIMTQVELVRSICNDACQDRSYELHLNKKDVVEFVAQGILKGMFADNSIPQRSDAEHELHLSRTTKPPPSFGSYVTLETFDLVSNPRTAWTDEAYPSARFSRHRVLMEKENQRIEEVSRSSRGVLGRTFAKLSRGK